MWAHTHACAQVREEKCLKVGAEYVTNTKQVAQQTGCTTLVVMQPPGNPSVKANTTPLETAPTVVMAQLHGN